jgi:hypothetical protein
VVFLAHFDSLIGHISTRENSGSYSKIGYWFKWLFYIFPFNIYRLINKYKSSHARAKFYEADLERDHE